MTRRSLLASSSAAVGCVLSGASPVFAQALEKTNLRFNWSWVGNYAPIVMGVQRGYFKELGVDLRLDQGKGSGATVRQAGSKNDKFVWADQSAVFVAAAQGVPVVAVYERLHYRLSSQEWSPWRVPSVVLCKPPDSASRQPLIGDILAGVRALSGQAAPALPAT